jgi:hypothetical protein
MGDANADYADRLEQYKKGGRGSGFGFKPRPEDVESANAARQKVFPSNKQEVDDAKIRVEEEQKGGAPTPGRTYNTIKPNAKGGAIKKYASGGSIRGGGIESKGKTKGRFV